MADKTTPAPPIAPPLISLHLPMFALATCRGESLRSHSIGLNYLLSWSTMSSAEGTKAGEVGPSGKAPFVRGS